MNLIFYILVSKFVFTFNLYRYTKGNSVRNNYVSVRVPAMMSIHALFHVVNAVMTDQGMSRPKFHRIIVRSGLYGAFTDEANFAYTQYTDFSQDQTSSYSCPNRSSAVQWFGAGREGLYVTLNDAHWSALLREPMTQDLVPSSSNPCSCLWVGPSPPISPRARCTKKRTKMKPIITGITT